MPTRSNITVVLDDDPTGTQCVYDIPVLTTWEPDALREEFEKGGALFFLLTNSRALPTQEAFELIEEICHNLNRAAGETGRWFNIILRSDSTLRGHFPAEADAVESVVGAADRWIICPFFDDGGRITLDDVHYIKEQDTLTPVADTPFAKDATFGYKHSNLREWVEEKTNGRIRAGEVGSLDHRKIRGQGSDYVIRTLRENRKVWIVNASSMNELNASAEACKRLEGEGMKILYRTGASFVQAYAGIDDKKRLDTIRYSRAPRERKAGLVVVGSYVPKTTEQLEHLLQLPGLHQEEIDVESILNNAPGVIGRVSERMNRMIAGGNTVVLYTSRRLLTAGDDTGNLSIGKKVSEALVDIVKSLYETPAFLIAKGGITSSDVASKGLGVRRAMILGQALPGVPVWLTGPESKFPSLPYVVFPGNVGGPDALADLVRQAQRLDERQTRW